MWLHISWDHVLFLHKLCIKIYYTVTFYFHKLTLTPKAFCLMKRNSRSPLLVDLWKWTFPNFVTWDPTLVGAPRDFLKFCRSLCKIYFKPWRWASSDHPFRELLISFRSFPREECRDDRLRFNATRLLNLF